MSIVLFDNEITSGQLKNYANVICFSQVGLDDAEISSRLDVPQYLVAAWIENWIAMDSAVGALP